jgi:hypothetical protein
MEIPAVPNARGARRRTRSWRFAGADLAHILAGLFLPAAGFALMALAGPFYPARLFLVGRKLFRAARPLKS